MPGARSVVRRMRLPLILVIGIGVIVWGGYPRRERLLGRSTRIISFDTNNYNYWWCKGSELLYINYEPVTVTESGSGAIDLHFNIQPPATASLYDLHTGMRRSLPTALGDMLDIRWLNDPGVQASPDGNWLLVHNSRRNEIRFCRPDGSQIRAWKYTFDNQADDQVETFWTADSKSFVRFMSDETSDPGREHYRALVYTVADGSCRKAVISPESMLDKDIVSLSSVDHILVEDSPDPLTWNIYSTRLGAGARPVKIACHHFPVGTEVLGHVYSPSGDRIAWLLHQTSTDRVDRWLHRLLPFWKVPEQYSLCISDLKGDEMQEVGYLTPKEAAASSPRPYTIAHPSSNGTTISISLDLTTEPLEDIRWAPDGKHLSFIYDGGLYITPAGR